MLVLQSRNGHALGAGLLGDRRSGQPENLTFGGKLRDEVLEILGKLCMTIGSPPVM